MTYYKIIFELFEKLHSLIYAIQFMTSQVIPLSFVLLNLESVEKKGKITKMRTSQEQKEPLDEMQISQLLKGFHFVKK